MISKKVERMFERLPVIFDWAEYQGINIFVGANPEASEKAGKPMMDIFYCATEALNNNVMMTVQFDKGKFSKSRLANCEWESIKDLRKRGDYDDEMLSQLLRDNNTSN